MRPAMTRSRTVFPEPLPPMTTSVSPLNASNDRPWRTSRLSNRFQTSLTSTIAVIALLSPEEDEKQLGEEEVGDDHPHRDVDDGGRRCPPQPFRASLDAQAVVAAAQRDDAAEEEALAHPHEVVARHDPVGRPVPARAQVAAALADPDH